MRIIASGKNVEITDALRDTIERKLGKLGKFFLAVPNQFV